MKQRGLQPLRRILPTVLGSRGIGPQLEARHVLEEARRVLAALWGEERASHCAVGSFRDGTMTVHVRSAPALQALRLDEVRVLNELNRRLGSRKVLHLSLRRVGF